MVIAHSEPFFHTHPEVSAVLLAALVLALIVTMALVARDARGRSQSRDQVQD
jgi:hypothetical protein